MAIQVTCPGCLKRFSVADQHAGKQGPCPSCKKVIKIPKLEDQVVIHEAPPEGPRDAKGRSVLKTKRRTDARFQPLVAVAVGAVVLLALLAAFLIRGRLPAETLPAVAIMVAGAAILAPFIVRGGYMVLRDDELEPYHGIPLLLRSLACGVVFALSWLLFGFILTRFATPEDLGRGVEIWVLIAPLVVMFLVGLGAGVVSLDLTPANAILLFALFFLATASLRVVMGLPFLPGLGAASG
jgi:hypothetical protein